MKRIKLMLFLFIFPFLSCGSKENKKKNAENSFFKRTNPIIINAASRANFTIDTLELSEDAFISRSLSQLTLTNISSIYTSINPTQQFLPNMHYPTKTDTLVAFISNADTLIFHKGIGGKIIFEKMNLETNVITIDGNVTVGMSKSAFEQKFNQSNVPDICIVQDTEGGNIFTFIFDNNILNRILFRVIYD